MLRRPIISCPLIPGRVLFLVAPPQPHSPQRMRPSSNSLLPCNASFVPVLPWSIPCVPKFFLCSDIFRMLPYMLLNDILYSILTILALACLQPGSRVEQVSQLRVGELAVEGSIGTLAVPSPLLLELGLQLILEHLHHVLAQHGEELVPVE